VTQMENHSIRNTRGSWVWGPENEHFSFLTALAGEAWSALAYSLGQH